MSPFGQRERGNSSVGRAPPCQGGGRRFESGFPLLVESGGGGCRAALLLRRRRSQVVRQRSAKPPFGGSNPPGASCLGGLLRRESPQAEGVTRRFYNDPIMRLDARCAGTMAYIRYASPAEGGPQVSALRDRYGGSDGRLDNILRIHLLNPPSLEHHYLLYRHLMTGSSPLSRVQREMIAVAVSAENDCFY